MPTQEHFNKLKGLISPRVVYHLNNVKKFLDPETHIKVNHILAGKWAHEDMDVFADVGNALKKHKNEDIKQLGQAYNWGRMKHALLLDMHVKDWADNFFAKDKAVYEAQGKDFYRQLHKVLTSGAHPQNSKIQKSLNDYLKTRTVGMPTTLKGKYFADAVQGSLERLAHVEWETKERNKAQTAEEVKDLLHPLPTDVRDPEGQLDDSGQLTPAFKKLAGYSTNPMAYKAQKDFLGNTYHREFLEKHKSHGKSEDELWGSMSCEFHYTKDECKKFGAGMIKMYGGNNSTLSYAADYENCLKYTK